MIIGGREVSSASGDTFSSVNPTTGLEWATMPDAGSLDVDRAVDAARDSFETGPWRTLSATRRGRLMMRLADRVLERADEIATVEVRENGKLFKEMRTQLGIVPDWLYYFGGLADKIEGTVIPLDRTSILNYTLREPLGVVGIITPWNSPVLLTAMGLCPALAAGNTVVIKPSEMASAGVLEFARLAADAGFPPGVINVVTGGPSAGEALVAHPDVAKVTFTGGQRGGRQIAQTVGARLGKYTLELGGKSPNIVFADADLDAATAGVLAGIYGAGGQTCVAGSRALLERPVFDEVLERLRERADTIRLGDPLNAETQMGPMATEQQLMNVEQFVSDAESDGASVVSGGARAQQPGLGDGFFFQPTILRNVPAGSAVLSREVFGPVLAVIPFDGDDEAAQIANDTVYGLAAGIWTQNVKRAHRLARRIQAGTVWINTYRAVTFNSPFGGYKQSGIGHVNGASAVDEYLQTKSVWVELDDELQDPFTLKS